MVGQGVGHHQQTVLLHRSLGMVMLIEAIVVAVFHDVRLWIGEMVLVLVPWPGGRWDGWTAARIAPGLASFCCPLAHVGFVCGLLGCIAFLGTGCQNGPCLGQVCQPLLAKGEFSGDHPPSGSLGRLGRLSEGEQLVHFSPQSAFEFEQTLVTDGLALGSVGRDFGPVQTDVSHLSHANFLGV